MNKYREELRIANAAVNAATWAASHTSRSAAWAANAAARSAARSAVWAASDAAWAANEASSSEEELNYQIDKVLELLNNGEQK